MRNLSLFCLLGALIGLGACQTPYKKSPVVTPQRMVCSGGNPAQITLYSPENAVLQFEDKKYELEREQVASGVKYSSRQISFWNKGIDAMITRGNGSIATCTYIPRSGL